MPVPLPPPKRPKKDQPIIYQADMELLLEVQHLKEKVRKLKKKIKKLKKP